MFDIKDCLLYSLWQDIKKLFWFCLALITLTTTAVIIVVKYLK